MRKLNFLKMMLLAVVMMVGSGVWGQVAQNIIPIRSEVAGFIDWTDTDIAGTAYIQLLRATSSVVTPSMNFNDYTGETLSFNARSYGGTSEAENTVYVAISIDNGNSWIELGSRTPNSNTLTLMNSFDLSTYNSDQVKVKFYVKGTNNSVGAGISNITFKGVFIGIPPTSAPIFSPPAGTYTSAQSVELSSATDGAKIYYTIDGTEPTNASTHYSSAINVATTTTIKAIAYDEYDENPSSVVSASYVIDLSPQLTITPNTSSAMNNVVVGESNYRDLSVSGINLTENLIVSISGDTDQFNLSVTSIEQTDGTVSNAPVRINYVPTKDGSHSVEVDISHGGTSLFTRTISGTAVYPPLAQPIATDATNITSNSFTANWEEVVGATEYELDVYTVVNSPFVEKLNENFSSITNGNSTNTSGSGTVWEGNTNFPTVARAYQAGGAVRLGISNNSGYITSKTLNSDTPQEVKVSLDIKGWTTVEGDIIVSIGSVSKIITYTSVIEGSFETKSVTFANISGDFTVKIATSSKRAFVDNVIISVGGDKITKVEGSPFTVTSNSFNVTGIETSTTYYYTVVAKNENVTSDISNEIEVTTLSVPFYRSATSGDWSAIETWEVSTDNGSTWSAATEIPSQMAASISIQPDHLVTVDASANATASTLIIQPKGMLTVGEGTLETGNFQILSDATGTGTILNYSGEAEVQQYLASRRNWYMSVPVNEMTTAPSGFGYWYYDESTGAAAWPTTTSLVAGKGYLVYPNEGFTADVITFNGILNSEDINVEMTRSSSNTTKPGYNLVGNPYPSYLDVSNLKNNTSIEPSLWYRTKTGSGNYVFDLLNLESGLATNPSGLAVTYEVPPMQAFWLRVAETETSATVNFLESNRKHGSEPDVVKPPFRAPSAGQSEQSVLRLRVSNGIDADEAIIYFNGNALSGYDRYDSYKMSNGNLAIPEIYTLLNNKQVAINGMNAIPYDIPIALGFVTGTAGNFTITANEVQNFADNVVIILKDNVTGIETDLTKTPSYTFSSEALRTSERFSVIFPKSDVPTSVSEKDISKFLTYTKEDQIIIQIDESLLGADIFVYNNVGQLIVTQKANSLENAINKSLLPGVYFVKIKNQAVKTVIR